jgi:N,N'-diacetyllegionaminate synthase
MPEVILGLANAHEGKFNEIKKSINFYNILDYENKSIKFQIFKYSEIATEDFYWFNIYKKLFISDSIWRKIFKLVKNKKIWIDVFDNYSLELIKKIKNIFMVLNYNRQF